jgi:Ni/Fe-hydrogenase subunit HybB-like protein
VIMGLARGSLVVAAIYFVLKAWLLISGPGIGAAFDGSFTANMYLLEMLIGVVLPLVLLSVREYRTRMSSIFAVNILVIVGTLLNRMNVGIFGLADYASRFGVDYFPSTMEFVLTAGMVAFAFFGFKVSAKYLNLFPGEEH